MNIKQNDMTYDSEAPRCQLFIGGTAATGGLTTRLEIAFITVIDDSTQCLKRYFGVFDWATREDSIRNIMSVGGKWPDAFASKALPEGAELFD